VSSDSRRYLLSDFSIITTPSLNVFLLCSEKAKRSAGRKDEVLLSIGNPAFDRIVHPNLRDLPSATREAKEIARNYSRSYELVGSDATKTSILNRLSEANVIHFAGHYITNERYPEFSKLILARGQRASQDDPDLSAAELTKHKLPSVKLVILSACQTAGERYYSGEGLIGIARTFLEAGSPLVIATQWQVESESTTQMMVRFHYYRTVSGASSFEALRQAQLELLQEPGGLYRDPYYWAAFLTVGGYADF
jgi:CHAT domain-containing protein